MESDDQQKIKKMLDVFNTIRDELYEVLPAIDPTFERCNQHFPIAEMDLSCSKLKVGKSCEVSCVFRHFSE